MPGYISITPRFNPISLQEYLTVPTMIMNEYGKAEDVYNETATKAEALKALLGERNANNEAGWRIVDNYEKQLGDLASEMANGIQGPETYRRAKQSRAYYIQNMLPLETGIPAYQEDLKRWESDPTMIGNKPSLGTYISNPLYREDMVSGNLIQQEAMKAATAASARRKSNPKYGTAFGGSYHTIMNQIGFSPEEVQAWLNNPESSPELTEIYNQIASKYGKFNIEQVNPYIIRGMLDGIAYDNKIDYKENKNYVSPAQRAALQQQRDAALAQAYQSLRNINPLEGTPFSQNIRVATWKRDDVGNAGSIFDYKDDKLQIKNKRDFIQALTGFSGLGSKAIYGDKNAKEISPEKMFDYVLLPNMFKENGNLVAPAQLRSKLMHNRNVKIAPNSFADDGNRILTDDNINHIVENYKNFYQQLVDFGVPSTNGFVTRDWRVQNTENLPDYLRNMVDLNSNTATFENLYSYLQQNIPYSQEAQTNAGHTTYEYRTDVDNIIDMVTQSQGTPWREFHGLTRGNDKKTLVTKDEGEQINNEDLVKKLKDAKENNTGVHLEFEPNTENWTIEIGNGEDTETFYNSLGSIVDITGLNRNQSGHILDFEGANNAVEKYNICTENATIAINEYMNNPTDINYNRALKWIEEGLIAGQQAGIPIRDLDYLTTAKSTLSKGNSINLNTQEGLKRLQ